MKNFLEVLRSYLQAPDKATFPPVTQCFLSTFHSVQEQHVDSA